MLLTANRLNMEMTIICRKSGFEIMTEKPLWLWRWSYKRIFAMECNLSKENSKFCILLPVVAVWIREFDPLRLKHPLIASVFFFWLFTGSRHLTACEFATPASTDHWYMYERVWPDACLNILVFPLTAGLILPWHFSQHQVQFVYSIISISQFRQQKNSFCLLKDSSWSDIHKYT